MTRQSHPPRLLDAARFQREVDGKPVVLYQLRNSRGMVACITNYGAKLQQLIVPGPLGASDVVLGYDSLEAVIGGAPSVGAFIGRYAGRIGHAAFTLNGQTWELTANNGLHCLHGGKAGSRFRVFDAVQRTASSVEMSYVFADGEEGFPGALALRLMYSLTDANELVLDYEAMALDKPTVASFTPHPFFNLDGEGQGNVLQHDVLVNADRYLGATSDLVATGDVLPVVGTPFDLRTSTRLDARIGATGLAGYDNCFVVNRSAATKDGDLACCARVSSVKSGRVMEVWSTEPAVQLFTGLDGTERLAGGPGKNGAVYFQQQGICVEPQGYPNAPNLPQFPSSLYTPGQSRHGCTIYRFQEFQPS